MTLACIVGMGCAMLLTLDAGQAVVTAALADMGSLGWPLMPSMEGQSATPELHPPTSAVCLFAGRAPLASSVKRCWRPSGWLANGQSSPRKGSMKIFDRQTVV